MRRREFLDALGERGGVAALGAGAAAKRRSTHRRVPRVGHRAGRPGCRRNSASAQDVDAGRRLDRRQKVRFDVRYGSGNLAKIGTAADELVALAPELIYATGLPPVQALRQRTRTIPMSSRWWPIPWASA